MKHNYSLQLIARIFIAGLFLQGCGGLSNISLNGIEEQNRQPDIQAIIGREFVAEGGHLVKFYDEAGELKANVQMNAPRGFSKTHEGLPVAVEQGTELAKLPRLDEQAQKRRIQFQLAKSDQQAKVIIYKGAGLMGGDPSEVILFCGNPGVGKSTLCNSIFGRKVFDSGLSFGTGLTTTKQEHIHENKVYIDTPGLEDIEMRKQAGLEIEEALKKNKNYKIVFVATFENGRIRPADFATINTVCEAISKDVVFEYGLIFNQIPALALPKIEAGMKNTTTVNRFLQTLKKKPSEYVLLEKIDAMEAAENMYFERSHKNRERLLAFLHKLKANEIKENKVNPLDIEGYEARIEKMERSFREAINGLQRTIESQRDRINELEDDRNKTC
jgi:GTP-binding protein EngB required for normal cell division